MSFQVQFITHFTETISYLDSVRIALEGGCRWIQLRMKHATEAEVRETAGKALPLCRQYGATLILDDHVELVRETGADGVHLGLTDMPVAEARKILPKEQYIIGGTANTLEHNPAGGGHRRRHGGGHPRAGQSRAERHCPERQHPAGRQPRRGDEEGHGCRLGDIGMRAHLKENNFTSI